MAKRRRPGKVTAFLDSSVLFTAVNSPFGGSAKLFTLKNVHLTTSKVVLAEVERNVRNKLQDYHLERFFRLASKITILNQTPTRHLVAKAKTAIVEKDAVILAEGKRSGARFLVTLDRKHFLTPPVTNLLKPKKAVTPKELVQLIEKNP